MNTKRKIQKLVRELERDVPMGISLMYERLLTSADQLRKFAEQERKSGRSHVIHPDVMTKYADCVKKCLD